ncbi:MAG: nucleoside deaminase [Candidatus Magnetomorum sp.]|nr:nucleoside deaminase [Candidatus Magnetomorum sp.]
MNDITFMKQALQHAETALKRGDFPVGCVLTLNDQIIATGERTGTIDSINNELDHAEINALRQLNKREFHKSIDTDCLTIYCTLEPCLMCFSAIMIHGISRVVYAFEDVMGGGAGIDRSSLTPLYRNHHIEIVSGVCRTESLRLFQTFFSDTKNSYLTDSFLANHVRNQVI